MIKMIVFDMAGTTVNENNVVYKTLQRAIKEGGVNVNLDQVLEDGAGKEKKNAIQDIVRKYAPGRDDLPIEVIYENFLVLLANAYEHLVVTPVSGAEDVFEQLREKNIRVVLNTGYNRKTAELLLDKLDWEKGQEYDELVTASDVSNTRPQPDMIMEAMRLYGITEPAEVCKVGDSIIDIEEGKNAGCGITVGITTGAHTREKLESAHPDHIIDDIRELMTWVQGS